MQLARNMLHANMESQNIFKNIWVGIAPPRVEMMVWFAIIGKLKTKDRLNKLNILQARDLRCVLCKNCDETMSHLFIECPFTWKTWCCYFNWIGISWAAPDDLKVFFESWLATYVGGF